MRSINFIKHHKQRVTCCRGVIVNTDHIISIITPESSRPALAMIMAVKEDCGKIGGPQECAGCGKKIHDKFLLKVK